MTRRLHWPAGSLAEGSDPLVLTPEQAGWRYTGLHVIRLAAGAERTVRTGSREMLVLPLAGACSVEVEGHRFALRGRPDVFSGLSDYAYLPVDATARLVSEAGAELALPFALAGRRLPPAYGAVDDGAVEVRGAGSASRQITNLFTAGRTAAHRLIVVEVLTPPGNWSSYPPHKHDEPVNGEAVLEEIYYFRIPGPGGFGLHRTYTADRAIDETVVVRDGDAFLVPRGYHGPCVAAPEFPMYYLNVLAGPSDSRSLGFSDDPAYAWIRETWRGQAADPRVPLATSGGPRG